MASGEESTVLRSFETTRDILLWKNQKQSIAVLFLFTATWVALDLFQFTFITLASWISMAAIVSLFLWSNLMLLLGKEIPDLSWLEITESSVLESAAILQIWVEASARWLFSVAMERNLFSFVLVVSGLWVFSLLSSRLDLLTLMYLGVLLGFTAPLVYTKHEEKIKGLAKRLQMESKRLYNVVDEKLLKKIKSHRPAKAKKTE